MLSAYPGLLFPPVSDPVTWTSQHDVEVHSVDTNAGIVLDSEIDMLVDSESEVALVRETSLPELVFLDLEASLEDLLCLGSTDGAPA